MQALSEPYVPSTAPYLDEQDAFRIHIERLQRHRAATQGPPPADRAASHAAALANEAILFGRRRTPLQR